MLGKFDLLLMNGIDIIMVLGGKLLNYWLYMNCLLFVDGGILSFVLDMVDICLEYKIIIMGVDIYLFFLR